MGRRLPRALRQARNLSTARRILAVAEEIFASEGLAGARMEEIARAAKVNKALLYYYFKDKEAIYDAVLDQVFGGVRAAIHGALSRPLPPRPSRTSRPARWLLAGLWGARRGRV